MNPGVKAPVSARRSCSSEILVYLGAARSEIAILSTLRAVRSAPRDGVQQPSTEASKLLGISFGCLCGEAIDVGIFRGNTKMTYVREVQL